MGDNPSKPPPDWFKALLSQPPTRQQPSALAAMLEPPYVYPFKDAKEELKLAVWSLGRPIPGYVSTAMRYDCEGNIILFSQHGNCDSEYGWEIDHKHPKSKGGSDELWNLQPLHWRNNRRKGNKVIIPPPIRRQ